jgi:excisionase family DNA binding protein
MKAAPVTPARGRMFRPRSAAEYLGITVSRVRRLIASGDLVSIRTSTGRLEGVYEQDCDAWVEKHRQAATPVPPRPSVDDRLQHLLPKVRRFA